MLPGIVSVKYVGVVVEIVTVNSHHWYMGPHHVL